MIWIILGVSLLVIAFGTFTVRELGWREAFAVTGTVLAILLFAAICSSLITYGLIQVTS